MNSFTHEKLVSAVTRALQKILVFRGIPDVDNVAITPQTDPVSELGISSEDLVLVGPELSQESQDLDLPNEVFDWADDSSGRRRNRTVGEIADRISRHLETQEGVSHG